MLRCVSVCKKYSLHSKTIFNINFKFKLKPDSEYPDWLWNIHIGPPLTLEQLDPESKKYWFKLRKMGLKRNNRLSKLRRF